MWDFEIRSNIRTGSGSGSQESDDTTQLALLIQSRESSSQQPTEVLKMSQQVPNVTLNNGKVMPILGLGTWKSPPGQVKQAVQDAIDAGYRHFDCARIYQNESEVGEALEAKINEGVVTRDVGMSCSLLLWSNAHMKGSVVPALKKTLADLKLDFVDMYLIHVPMSTKDGEDLLPIGPDGFFEYSDVDYVETWKGMEEAAELGLAKSIGISNFNNEQVDRLLDSATIKPATLQVEVSPYWPNAQLLEFCQSRDITVTGYSSFGGSNPGERPKILDDAIIKDIAPKYGKSVSQVILRWLVQRSIVAIPKSVTKQRIVENFNVFDFTLSEEDMTTISDLGKEDGRSVRFPFFHPDHKFFPFSQGSSDLN